MSNRIWITWENHRRSKELAEALQAGYHVLVLNRSRWIRYPVLTIRTFLLLMKLRPKIVFSQNPSMVLAALLCVLAPLMRYKLIIDRHSNFKFETAGLPDLKWKIFHVLSRWTVRNADLTIVTNEYLAELITKVGGRPFVLQDKLPNMDSGYAQYSPDFIVKSDKPKVMFVTTFSDDEPIEEIIASKKFASDSVYYITGKYSRYYSDDDRNELAEQQVVLTGFVSEADYFNLMRLADLVVVLTIKENLLTCGAYEALDLKKPLVLSDTLALKSYFSKGAVYVGPSRAAIAEGVKEALANLEPLRRDVELFVPELVQRWERRFTELEIIVKRFQ